MTMDEAAPERPAKADVYSGPDIVVLEGVECVRKRPGMYFGDIADGGALHNLVQTVIEHAVDEHVEDRCFRLAVTIHAGGALTVEDDGPGFSVDVIDGERLSMLEGVFTRRHIRDRRASLASYALHGVGLGAVSALCERLVVEVRRGGRLHRLSCRRGRAEGPVAVLGPAEGTGMRITLHPDPTIFPSTTFIARRLLDLLRPLAFRHPGLRIDFADERPGGAREIHYGRGIAAWIELFGEGQEGFPDEPLRLRAAREDVTIDVALRWLRGPRTYVRAFANDHEVEAAILLAGLARGVKVTARRAGLADEVRRWDPQRLSRGLTAIVDMRGGALDLASYHPGRLASGGVHLLREAVADRLVEVLGRQPALLRELIALTTSAG